MNNNKSLFGGPLKRIKIYIQTKLNPEKKIVGHALTHELLSKQISFFSTQKFTIDEELTISYELYGEKKTQIMIMKSLQEQISSGKIMNMLPDENNLYPTQLYYRCYTQAAKELALAAPIETEEENLMSAVGAVPSVEAPEEAELKAA